VSEAQKRQILFDLLDEMTQEDADHIMWLDIDEMTHQEVADLLRRPLSTVKNAHARARGRLLRRARQRYADEQGGEQ
jgi:DNA-directed RNA polymerase specialized sigma24 family protein